MHHSIIQNNYFYIILVNNIIYPIFFRVLKLLYGKYCNRELNFMFSETWKMIWGFLSQLFEQTQIPSQTRLAIIMLLFPPPHSSAFVSHYLRNSAKTFWERKEGWLGDLITLLFSLLSESQHFWGKWRQVSDVSEKRSKQPGKAWGASAMMKKKHNSEESKNRKCGGRRIRMWTLF